MRLEKVQRWEQRPRFTGAFGQSLSFWDVTPSHLTRDSHTTRGHQEHCRNKVMLPDNSDAKQRPGIDTDTAVCLFNERLPRIDHEIKVFPSALIYSER